MTDNLEVTPAKRAATSRLTAIRRHLETTRPELLALFGQPGSSGVTLARRHAQIMDSLLVRLYAATAGEQHCPPFLLGAVGGFGRELLGWRSDLDVWFITEAAAQDIQTAVEAVLYPLWDAGVSIGHQVINLSEVMAAAAHDLPTATALLDFRSLAGDESLFLKLHERAYASVFSEANLPEFLAQLEAQADARHGRFGDSVYLLEPDVKNGSGGLRDLDLALWSARARWRTNQVAQLEKLGILGERDAEELEVAADFLWTVRNHLHRLANRRSDRLTFAEQELIAEAMQYRGRISLAVNASPAQEIGPMVEAFMSDYYRHARAIMRGYGQILGRAKRRMRGRSAREIDLGQGMVQCNDGVGIRESVELSADPALALRLYATAVARDLSVLARSRDRVARAAADADFAAALRGNVEARELFVKLATARCLARFRNGSILGELHDVGLLVAMIPEFAPVVGRVHHDLYHVYTVDVHSVAAVDRLRALLRGELSREHPLACELAGQLKRPAMLCLATLLHDVGKAIGATDHSRRGAVMARAILDRLALPPQDIDAACHLIEKHLVMYRVAVRRDLEDPTAIAEFAREVQGRDGLLDLYLLTVADLATTSPTSLTKWKARMLDALYRASDALLSGNAAPNAARIARVHQQVREHWRGDEDAAFLSEYLATMPERYLLSNTPAEIAAHARVAKRLGKTAVSAALVPSRHLDVAELCVVTESRPQAGLFVVTHDRPGLLAAITAAITACRLEIHAAQIHSRQLPSGGAQAVDLFWVRSARGSEGVRDVLPKLERDLEQVITGRIAAKDLLRARHSSPWSERPVPSVSTEIMFHQHASAEHSVIEVLTKDRPGLLFTLAQALHELGMTIAVAKVNTEGSRASDVFYVTEADGKKLAGSERIQRVRERLLEVLGEGA